jgi:hypothetical protein
VAQTTWTDYVAQYERLSLEHAELEFEFKHLTARRPINIEAHHQLTRRLAEHRRKLAEWRLAFHAAASGTDSVVRS